jgi:class 3 adenylate cyclase
MSVNPPRTNGFLFADLRDYTRFVETYGDRAAAALLETYRGLVRSTVGDFGGAEIKTEGDSFYVVFPSASSAVQCGLAILQAAVDPARTTGTPIRVGIGVHAGETVETDEGYVGSAVNVAARVCSQAKAGELLVTDTVRALTRTMLPVRFVDRHSRRLKGISEPVTLYRVVAEGVAETGTPVRGTGRALGGVGRTVRVAVLLTGLLVGGAAAGYLMLAAQRPPGTAATPTASPATTFPTAEELALVESVPLAIRDTCRRTTEAVERLGSIASVRCDLELAADADTVWFDRFQTDQQLATAFDVIRLRERPPFGDDCSLTVSRAAGNWRTGSTHAGALMCFQTEGETWIVWTYRADRTMARAVRSGTATDDWSELYAWWDNIKLFQR